MPETLKEETLAEIPVAASFFTEELVKIMGIIH